MNIKQRIMEVYNSMDSKKYSPSGLYYLDSGLMQSLSEINKELSDMLERNDFSSTEAKRQAADLCEELESKLKNAHIDSDSFDSLFDTAWKLQKFSRDMNEESLEL
jgi:hypothetical protein